MTDSLWRVLGLALSFALALSAVPAATAAAPAAFPGRPTLTFVYEVRANPPRYLGEGTFIDWDRPGLSLELLKQVGETLRINLSFKRVPWKRGLLMVQTGEADGIFHASFKQDRERIGVYPKTADGMPDPSRAIFTQSYALHVMAGSPVTWDGTAIGGLGDGAVGATDGYSIVSDLERMGVRVETAKIQELNLSKLVQGRIAAYAELENMAAAAIRQQPDAFADVVMLQPPLVSKPYYLLLSHQFVDRDPELARKVWDAIVTVNGSAAFKAMTEAYVTRP